MRHTPTPPALRLAGRPLRFAWSCCACLTAVSGCLSPSLDGIQPAADQDAAAADLGPAPDSRVPGDADLSAAADLGPDPDTAVSDDGGRRDGAELGPPPECAAAESRPCPGGSELGACTPGQQRCRRGRWGACQGRVDPTPELCNGLDDDCDGALDEGLDDQPAGPGVCADAVRHCAGALGWREPERTGLVDYQPLESRCDGLDNDCDGRRDLDGRGQPLAQACLPAGSVAGAPCSGGVQRCEAGSWGVCLRLPGDRSEVCDGRDNDCNGLVDDVLGAGEGCGAGIGGCHRAGQLACDLAAGQLLCDVRPGRPAAETCDGLDDDCDGQTDEGVGLAEPCAVGLGACRRSGARVCAPPQPQAVCDLAPGPPSPETCNSLDDDCDGLVDEPPEPADCLSGRGQCQAAGRLTCTAAQREFVCDAVPGPPGPEVFNGLDDDCDDQTDEWPECDPTFRSLTAGALATCGIRGNGEVLCWGQDDGVVSQLPVGVRFRQLDLAPGRACGIRADDGGVTCWARAGQEAVPAGRFVHVAVASLSTCALREDRELACWAPLGLAAPSLGAGPWREVVAGEDQLCALHADGRVVCAGDPRRAFASSCDHGLLFDRDGRILCLRADGSLIVVGDEVSEPLATAVDEAAGGRAGYCYVAQGRVRCSGWPLEVDPPVPGALRGLSAGQDHACGLVPGTGAPVCWGQGRRGQTTVPPAAVTELTTGTSHACLRGGDGRIACWGLVDCPQLGDWWSPGASGLDAGDGFTCGQLRDGRLSCWGCRPVMPQPPHADWVSYDVTDTAVCGLRLDGGVDCLGGQDPGPAPAGPFFTLVTDGRSACGLDLQGMPHCWGRGVEPASGPFASLTLGASLGCGLRRDGSAICWQRDGAGIRRELPPPRGEVFAQLAVGDATAFGRRADGSVLAWGASGERWTLSLAGRRFQRIDAEAGSFAGVTDDGAACWMQLDSLPVVIPSLPAR